MGTVVAEPMVLPRRQGISYAVVALIFAVGSGAIAFGILGDLQGNLDAMTGSEHLEILDINAYVQGDRLVITGNVKNLGSGMTSILIDEISSDDFLITQNAAIDDGEVIAGHGSLALSGRQFDGAAVSSDIVDRDNAPVATTLTGAREVCSGGAHPANGFILDAAGSGTACVASVVLSGLSTDEDSLSPMGSTATKSFRITVTGLSVGNTPGVLDVKRTIHDQEDLFVSFMATDGSTTVISKPRSDKITVR